MDILALSGTYKTSINSEGSMSLEVGSERKLDHLKDSLPLLVRNTLGEVNSLSSVLVYYTDLSVKECSLGNMIAI